MKLAEIAQLVHGQVEGEDAVEIERLAKIEEAGAGDITFLPNPEHAQHLISTKASAILVAKQMEFAQLPERKTPITLIRVDDPYVAFMKLIDVFRPPPATPKTKKRPSKTSTNGSSPPEYVREAGLALFASLIAQPVVGVLIEARDGTILSVNDAFCKLFNVQGDPKELVGRKAAEVAGPGVFSARPKQGNLSHEELRLRDGRVMERDYVQLVSNGFLGHMWRFRDVTELKRKEEQLHRRELLMAEVQQLVHLGGWDWDIRTNTVSWSDELYRILGLRPDQASPTYESFLSRVHPDDRDLVKTAIDQAYGNHQPFSFNHRIIRPDGIVRVLLARGAVVEDGEGNALRLIWTGLDVTEGMATEQALRESQQRYESLVGSIEGVVWEAEPDSLQFTFVSKQAERLLGYRADEWLNEASFWRNHILPDDREIVVARCREVARSNGRDEFEFRMVAADGRTVWLRGIVSAVAQQGGAAKLRGVMVDITEHKNVEAQLKDSFDQLRSLAARLQSIREAESTRIALEIHDELGQALTGLKMDLAWLNKKLPKDQKALLEKITSMTKLIDSTIHIVRKISTELRPGVLDDLGLVAAIEWQSDEFQERTGIHCVVSLPEVNLNLDRDKSTAVFRILQEALTNITRHAIAKTVTIKVNLDGDTLRLEVKDDGVGIPAQRIADPQSLGLAGMRERAFFLGGKLVITGQPTKGTTVSLDVPMQLQQRK